MSLADKQADIKTLAVAVASRIYHYKWIAASVGISEKTMIEWKKADAEFNSQLDKARAVFIQSNMKKARPDFLLQTADRETFAPPKQEVAVSGDIVGDILKAGGLLEGENSDTKNDGDSEGTS